MLYTKIATPAPFNEGAPKINAPSIYGASPNKPIIYKVPTLGKRPINFTANLPEGLSIDENGIITGKASEGEYEITVTAENEFGKSEKQILFHIAPDAVCLTPLLGWTSWNAFKDKINHDVIIDTARHFISTGLAEYGYSYVNIDSDWQGKYGGKYDAIMPNEEKFPDMKAMCDEIHSMGLKAGIYSTPMLRAFGVCQTLPGCTLGEWNPAYRASYGVGFERREENNAKQWAEWGFDYLKYDWTHTDSENTIIMKEALKKQDRDFAYCVTTNCRVEEKETWQKNCSSVRDNWDSVPSWEFIMKICFACDKWLGVGGLGHYFDLDMLETGILQGYKENPLTEDEQLVAYTARIIFPSPIQISCDLSKLSDFDMAMLCNEEVIAVNQDSLGKDSVCTYTHRTENADRELQTYIKIYERQLEDGKTAVAIFNIGNTVEDVTIPCKYARDLWAKENLEADGSELTFTLEPHTVRLIKK